MKWLIASDIHGSAACCRQVLDAFDREHADRLLLLGDLLYHGPRNDFPEEYDTKAVTKLLNDFADKHGQPFCVRGNCDSEVDQMVLSFPMLADYCLLESAGHVIFCTHGHLYNLETPPALRPGDVLLHGHTHVTAKDNTKGFWYCNPGSASLPKGNTPQGYMTLEGGVFCWKKLDGNCYDTLNLGE